MAGKKTTKKNNQNLSSVFFFFFFGRVVTSPVGGSGSSLFFLFHPFFNHSRPSLALCDDRKNCTAILCFILTVFTVATTIFHYSENIFQVYFSDLKKTAIQHVTKSKRNQKGKKWSQNLQKKLQLLLLIYQQLTYSEYRFKQSRH